MTSNFKFLVVFTVINLWFAIGFLSPALQTKCYISDDQFYSCDHRNRSKGKRALLNSKVNGRRSPISLSAESDNTNNDKKSGDKKKSTKFDRMLDDFIGKRYGAGEAFYGRRSSDLTEEEFLEKLRAKNNGKASREEEESYWRTMDLKENAILVVGDPLVTTMRWITFELLEKGFNVRVACPNIKEGIKVFGLPGYNVDFVELTSSCDDKSIARCVQSVQAIVLATNLLPPNINPLVSEKEAIQLVEAEFALAKRLVDFAERGNRANVGEVAKVVHLSRCIADLACEKKAFNILQSSPANKALTLLDAFDYIASLIFDPLEISILPSRFEYFRSRHRDFESVVRLCSIDYAILRAPPVIFSGKPGAQEEMMLTDKSSFSERNSGTIANLDIAEAVVNALLLEPVAGITASIASMAESETEGVGSSSFRRKRVAREAYYEVLALDDASDVVNENEETEEKMRAPFYQAMRNAYALRDVDTMKRQLEEDVAVEAYWTDLFATIRKD